MKHQVLTTAMFLTIFIACKPEVDYKQKREEVIKYHDVVMADAGHVVDKQMRLTGMLKDLAALKAKNPGIDTLVEKDSILAVQAKLNQADEAMNDWMHRFEPDVTGKSNAEAIAYFEAEKVKIQRVDSLFKQEIKFADRYLSKFKK
jgi:hypothetical protein